MSGRNRPSAWPCVCLLAVLISLTSRQTHAQMEDRTHHNLAGDFGGVGLLQLPSARFAQDSDLWLSIGRVAPHQRNAVMATPVPWIEGILRYTTVQNRDYGAAAFAGDQKYKDRSLDLKLRLLEESASTPQVAAGMRDMLGTGLFSSEYLVLNRRYYDFDFTIGMGWGNLGTRGQVPNPFGFLSDRFKRRPNITGFGGTATYQYFRGERASLLGGIAYHPPYPGLTLKIELDGNNYQSEAQANNQKVNTPINIGANYRFTDYLDISLGVERGNTLQAQLILHSNLKNVKQPKLLDPPPDKLQPRALDSEIASVNSRRTPSNNRELALRLSEQLEKRKYQLDSISIKGKRATVRVAQDTYRANPKAIGRAARVLANELPPEIEELRYVTLESGVATNQVTLLRKDFEKALNIEGSIEEIAANARIEAADMAEEDQTILIENRYPSASWGVSPSFRQHIGGPDNPFFYQIYLRADSELELDRGLSLTSALTLNVQNNFSGLKLKSDSQLPHVRSDIKEYLKQGASGINRMQLDYLTKLAPDWYARASAGLFEEMFGGIGGEVLYKPFGKPWALGGDLNYVRQRGFDERFSFRNYNVATGHVDAYWRLPLYNLLAKVSVGRYLAGDVGATFDLSRHYENGAAIGGFFTLTNVSAAQFGEGSFDKGLYISLPLDLLTLHSTRTVANLGWRPLTRDGGQRLEVGKRLYPLIQNSSPDAMMRDWGQLLD